MAFGSVAISDWRWARTSASLLASPRECLRTDKTRGRVSKETILTLVFTLVRSTEERWLRIQGFAHLADVIEGVPFQDEVRVEEDIQLADRQQDAT